VNIDINLTETVQKRFIITEETTIADFAKLIKEEPELAKNKHFSYQLNGKNLDEVDPISKEKLLKTALYNNFKIKSDHQFLSFSMDLQASPAFFDENPLDAALHNHHLPFQDADLIKKVSSQVLSSLKSKHTSKLSYSKEEIQQVLAESLKAFSGKRDLNIDQQEKGLEPLAAQYQKEAANVNQIEKNVNKSALSLINLGVLTVGVQWGVLFYLTYFAYGWDFTEPIGYLIGLSLETYGLWYFLRKNLSFDQGTIFEKSRKQKLMKKLFAEATNPKLDLKFLENKIKMIQAKSSMK
jgi:hypothetical protein